MRTTHLTSAARENRLLVIASKDRDQAPVSVVEVVSPDPVVKYRSPMRRGDSVRISLEGSSRHCYRTPGMGEAIIVREAYLPDGFDDFLSAIEADIWPESFFSVQTLLASRSLKAAAPWGTPEARQIAERVRAAERDAVERRARIKAEYDDARRAEEEALAELSAALGATGVTLPKGCAADVLAVAQAYRH